MITNFDIKNIKNDSDTLERFSRYSQYKDLYDGDFNRAFNSTVLKIRKRYPITHQHKSVLGFDRFFQGFYNKSRYSG